jgi:hypothetical protein
VLAVNTVVDMQTIPITNVVRVRRKRSPKWSIRVGRARSEGYRMSAIGRVNAQAGAKVVSALSTISAGLAGILTSGRAAKTAVLSCFTRFRSFQRSRNALPRMPSAEMPNMAPISSLVCWLLSQITFTASQLMSVRALGIHCEIFDSMLLICEPDSIVSGTSFTEL